MSKGKAVAKTASKNNPVARVKAKEVTYNGKKVKPVRFISVGRNFIAVQYDNGQLAVDPAGNVIPWSKINN